jgi:hypothetical protein
MSRCGYATGPGREVSSGSDTGKNTASIAAWSLRPLARSAWRYMHVQERSERDAKMWSNRRPIGRVMIPEIGPMDHTGETLSRTLAVAQQYFAAWNDHDPDAIAATFVAGGTYADPIAGELPGEAIGRYAAVLFKGYPDLRFEVVGTPIATDEQVSVQWVMRGTNTGRLRGNPPSGRTIAVRGAAYRQLRSPERSRAAARGQSDNRPYSVSRRSRCATGVMKSTSLSQ